MPGHDACGQGVKTAVAVQVPDAFAQAGDGDRLDLAGGAAGTPAGQDAVLLHPGPVLLQRLDEFVDALAPGGDRLHDRRAPVAGTAGLPEAQHVVELAGGGVGAVAVGLVHHVHVADLQDSGLGRLDAVAHARGEEDDGGVGLGGDLHLRLTDADGLHQDHVEARRVQHPDRLRGSPGEAAQMAARGHGTDVDTRVRGMVRHPDPVPEERAAGERRRRVDGEHGDPLALPPVGGDERRRRRRLADTGGSGQPDDAGVPRQGRQRRHHLAQLRRRPLHQGDEPGHGPRPALPCLLDQGGDVHLHARPPRSLVPTTCPVRG